MENQDQTETTPEVTPVTNISLQELQILHRIVDLASQRGAFRGNELSQVGAVYDRLTAFLNYVAAEQEAKQDQSEADQAETEVESTEEE